MSVEDDLATSIRSYAASRRLTPSIEARWRSWQAADARAMLGVCEALRLGTNQLTDILDWLEEIAARDGQSPHAVLDSPEVRGIMATRLGRSDKLKRLKASLRRRRYPRLSALERELDAGVRELDLGPGVQVRFPPALEGDEIRLEVKAKGSGDLRTAVTRLSAAVARGGFDKLFALLGPTGEDGTEKEAGER